MAKTKSSESKFERNDLDRIGLFSETSYISSGEPYVKKSENFLEYRCKGKQFQVLPPRLGIDSREPHVRLFENEPYVDVAKIRRRYRLQGKDKNITNLPFKPSSVPPKPSGKGSVWGTIEHQYPVMKKDYEMPLIKESQDQKQVVHEPKNFLTKPPKKGTGYGYNDVTIGKPHEYMSDPFDLPIELAKKERTENLKRNVAPRAFVTSSSGTDFFNKFECLNLDEKKSQNQKLNSHLPSVVPFKPTSKCGFTINPYPSYENPKYAKPEAYKKPFKFESVFKPNGTNGSYPIRSIMEVNNPIAPPKWLQEQLKKVMALSNY